MVTIAQRGALPIDGVAGRVEGSKKRCRNGLVELPSLNLLWCVVTLPTSSVPCEGRGRSLMEPAGQTPVELSSGNFIPRGHVHVRWVFPKTPDPVFCRSYPFSDWLSRCAVIPKQGMRICRYYVSQLWILTSHTSKSRQIRCRSCNSAERRKQAKTSTYLVI